MINRNYGLKIESIELIDSHFGTEIYLLQTDLNKYIVKTIPVNCKDLQNEGYITEFLCDKGISVAKILKTNKGEYSVRTKKMQFHIQNYIEGITLSVNTAPDWFMEKSAQTLGRIHSILKDYEVLERSFDDDFFNVLHIMSKKDFLLNLLDSKEAKKDETMAFDIKEQIKHADKIASFKIIPQNLTYSNSHGDYYIGQIITKDESFTVIDWSSACCLPICIEVIMSYTFADPYCSNGNIDIHRLKEYIKQYSQYFALSDYDLKIMPYLFYWHQFLTNYTPPFSVVPEGYKAVSKLINNLMNWLYENVDKLSNELCNE